MVGLLLLIVLGSDSYVGMVAFVVTQETEYKHLFCLSDGRVHHWNISLEIIHAVSHSLTFHVAAQNSPHYATWQGCFAMNMPRTCHELQEHTDTVIYVSENHVTPQVSVEWHLATFGGSTDFLHIVKDHRDVSEDQRVLASIPGTAEFLKHH